MLKIAICEDNAVHLEKAVKLVENSLENNQINYRIQLFHEPELLLYEIENNEYIPDIAVLDIDFNGEKGITLAKRMNQLLPLCRIIYLSAFIIYASDVYETEHVWFVHKKSADKYFPSAMERALNSLSKIDIPTPSIVVRQNSISTAVPVKDILYISRVNRKAYVCCTDREYYDTRRPALLIPDQLKKDFIHCHQGYWVNIHMIKELDHEVFVLQDGFHIPISRTFRKAARKQFLDYYRGIGSL